MGVDRANYLIFNIIKIAVLQSIKAMLETLIPRQPMNFVFLSCLEIFRLSFFALRIMTYHLILFALKPFLHGVITHHWFGGKPSNVTRLEGKPGDLTWLEIEVGGGWGEVEPTMAGVELCACGGPLGASGGWFGDALTIDAPTIDWVEDCHWGGAVDGCSDDLPNQSRWSWALYLRLTTTSGWSWKALLGCRVWSIVIIGTIHFHGLSISTFTSRQLSKCLRPQVTLRPFESLVFHPGCFDDLVPDLTPCGWYCVSQLELLALLWLWKVDQLGEVAEVPRESAIDWQGRKRLSLSWPSCQVPEWVQPIWSKHHSYKQCL